MELSARFLDLRSSTKIAPKLRLTQREFPITAVHEYWQIPPGFHHRSEFLLKAKKFERKRNSRSSFFSTSNRKRFTAETYKLYSKCHCFVLQILLATHHFHIQTSFGCLSILNIEFVLQITTTKKAVLIRLTQLIFCFRGSQEPVNPAQLWSRNIDKSFHTTKMNLDFAADIARAL